MSEDIDLYDDLPFLNFGESVSKIEEERQYFKEQLSKKEKDVEELKEQIAVLEKHNKTVEENISSLYKTAVCEIKRKDKIIEELRKEKDSIIFRRKSRQRHTINQISDKQKDEGDILPVFCPDSALSEDKNLMSIHGESTSGEYQKTSPAVISSSDSKHKDSDKNQPKSSENYPSLNENKVVFPHKGDSDIKGTVLKPVTSENSCSKVKEALLDNLSSCSSHESRSSKRSKSPDKSCDKKRLKDLEDRRSLSSENRRESKHKPSDKSSSHRTRYNSPNGRYRSPRSYDDKSRRDDKPRYHSGNRNYYRDEYKECGWKDKKFKVHNGNEFNGKYSVHSRRSPSPKLFKRYELGSNQRYSNVGHVSSKVGRSTKIQSDNVRLATQLKFKYSKTMRERSVSCSPVKRKGFIPKSCSSASEYSKSPSALDNSVSELNFEKRVSAQQVDNEHLKNSETFNKALTKCHARSASPSDCAMCMKQTCDKCKKYRIEDSSTWKQGVEEGPDCASILEQSNKLKWKELSSNKSSSGSIVQDNVLNVANTVVENCDVGLKRNTEASVLKLKNINSVEEHASGIEKDTLNKLASVTRDSLEDTNINKNVSEKKSAMMSGNDCRSQKIGSNFRSSDETTKSEKSFLMMNSDPVKLSSAEKTSCEVLPTRLSTTPPSKNLIPLKISPSFENPAVVKDNKFSHCVFNEQCEFKRHKQRRFKKLLVTEMKNENCTDNKERVSSKPYNKQYSETDSSGNQNFHFGKPVSSDSVRDCVLDEKINLLNTKNIGLKDNTESNHNYTFPNRRFVNEISRVSNSNESFNPNLQDTVILPHDEASDVSHNTASTFHQLPNDKLHQNKSPNKKRKLDSICEELKANLEKKTVADSVLPTATSNILSVSVESRETDNNCNNQNKINTPIVSDAKNLKCSDSPKQTAVLSSETPNRIVIPKRRRRIPNLQDNVVHVLTQVKSATP